MLSVNCSLNMIGFFHVLSRYSLCVCPLHMLFSHAFDKISMLYNKVYIIVGRVSEGSIRKEQSIYCCCYYYMIKWEDCLMQTY